MYMYVDMVPTYLRPAHWNYVYAHTYMRATANAHQLADVNDNANPYMPMALTLGSLDYLEFARLAMRSVSGCMKIATASNW